MPGTAGAVVGSPVVSRLGRILSSALILLSLGLFLASAGLWVRSCWEHDTLSYTETVYAWTPSNGDVSYALRMFRAESGRGMVGVQFVWQGERDADEREVRIERDCQINRGGAALLYEVDRFRRATPRAPFEYWTPGVWSKGGAIVLPLWPVVVVSGILPGLRLWRRVRRRISARKGCCRECGYDLRATPDRCPECGAAAPTPTPPKNSTSQEAGGAPAAASPGT